MNSIVKKQLTLTLIAFVAMTGTTIAQERSGKELYDIISIKNKGMLAPRQNFTGDVWVNMVEMFEDGFNGSVVGKVTFETKAWTNWHKHSQGQILIVTEGVGYYQEKESPVQIIRTGDVVKIPKDTEYWHGASHNSTMVHTAIVPGGSTTWLKEVTYVFQ